MTSSNGNIFRVTGPLCGEFTGPVNSPHKGQWRGALMFSLICVWINGWVNNGEAGDLRRHRSHYDVNVMWISLRTSRQIPKRKPDHRRLFMLAYRHQNLIHQHWTRLIFADEPRVSLCICIYNVPALWFFVMFWKATPTANFLGPTLAQRGSCRLHVEPTWAQRALLSG